MRVSDFHHPPKFLMLGNFSILPLLQVFDIYNSCLEIGLDLIDLGGLKFFALLGEWG